MTASLPPSGTTSSSPIAGADPASGRHLTASGTRNRSAARGLAAVLLALSCLLAAVPAAGAAGHKAARAHAAGAGHARPVAHAARSCAPARGFLFKRASVLRTQRRLLCLMNRTRARYGLRPLHANRCLHRVAARHAHDMVNRRYFAHTTPNGWDPGRRARASGYVPRRAAWLVGENIAWGVAGAARPNWVMNAWMHSPPHRHNLLSRQFRDVGIGVSRGVPVHGFGGVRLRATFTVEFGAHHGRTRCG